MTILSTILLVSIVLTAQATTVIDKEWRQLSDTGFNFTFNELDTIYDTSTGLLDTGTTSLKGVDFSGWTWASQTDATELLNYFIGSEILTATNTLWNSSVSTAAPDFFNQITAMAQTSTAQYSYAWTRTQAAIEITDRFDGGTDYINTYHSISTLPNRLLGVLLYRSTTVVTIDIKPGSNPNCFNVNGHGVIPVAILGSVNFDVLNIDENSLFFAGLEVRTRGKKGPLCGFEDINSDSFLDMVCHFEDDPINWAPGDADATLIGTLQDSTKFEGTDSICMVP